MSEGGIKSSYQPLTYHIHITQHRVSKFSAHSERKLVSVLELLSAQDLLVMVLVAMIGWVYRDLWPPE